MPAWVFQNGEFKSLEFPHTVVNNKIKDCQNIFVKVDDELRIIYGRISVEDVLGFKLIYTLHKDKKSEMFPNLNYNPAIPYRINRTDDSENMDYNCKGITFEYFDTQYEFHDDGNYEEGIIYYEGALYCLLKRNIVIDALNYKKKQLNGINNILENSTDSFRLSISYDTRYQGRGFRTYGWNSMFTNDEFLPKDSNDSKLLQQDTLVVNGEFSPINTITNYRKYCGVGIIRDMHDKYINTIGTQGMFSQSINYISVNETAKPFIIEIHE